MLTLCDGDEGVTAPLIGPRSSQRSFAPKSVVKVALAALWKLHAICKLANSASEAEVLLDKQKAGRLHLLTTALVASFHFPSFPWSMASPQPVNVTATSNRQPSGDVAQRIGLSPVNGKTGSPVPGLIPRDIIPDDFTRGQNPQGLQDGLAQPTPALPQTSAQVQGTIQNEIQPVSQVQNQALRPENNTPAQPSPAYVSDEYAFQASFSSMR